MQFQISRDALLKPLQLVSGVVERRQTLPVLANVLLVLKEKELSLTGTDLEVELVGKTEVDQAFQSGEVTVPARKLLDICKSLSEGAIIDIALAEKKLVLKCWEEPVLVDHVGGIRIPERAGRARYLLSQYRAVEAQATVGQHQLRHGAAGRTLLFERNAV